MKIFATTVALSVVSGASAGMSVIDFETNESGMPLQNGREIETLPEFGSIFDLSSTEGSSLGATIFDSDPMGPNAGGPDPDLLVGIGNILILQNADNPTQTTEGIFDTPNDSLTNGSFFFDFIEPVELSAIDVVDIDSGNAMTLTLTDTSGLNRIYEVPNGWTGDIADGDVGFGTVDLTTLLAQSGIGGTETTVAQDGGFDGSSVSSLEVFRTGSGGIDNIAFVPTPGSATLALGGMGLALVRRRR